MQVRVIHDRPEHVPRGKVKRKRRRLRREIGEPREVVRRRGLQQEHYDPGEVDVRDDHDVELPEEDELVHVANLLAVSHGSFSQVLDAPHDGEEDRAAADDVEEVEEVAPLQPARKRGAVGVHDVRRDVGEHLQRNHEHQHLLLALVEERLEEAPAGADEDDDGEEHQALRRGEDVERDVPSVGVAVHADHVVHERLAQHAQRLDAHEQEHEPVDPLDAAGLRLLGVEEHPRPHHRRCGEGEEGEHVHRGQRFLARAQVVLVAVRQGVVQIHGDRERNSRVGHALGVIERVLASLTLGDGVGELVLVAVLGEMRLHVLEGEEHEGVIEVVEEAPALGDVVLQRGVSLGRGDEETVAGLVDRVSALDGEQVHRVLDADLDGACASVGGLRANA